MAKNQLFQLLEKGQIVGHITASSITDIYYISRKTLGASVSKSLISDLISIFNVLGVDKKLIEDAVKSEILDFEDAVQDSVAFENGLDVIVTRNIKDFKYSKVPVVTPQDYLKKYSD
jgi:hypothetical protein